MNRTDRWSIVSGNLLPVAGAAFFGWSAAPAIFVIWLDALLCNLQLVIPVLAIFSRTPGTPGEEAHPSAYRVGAAIGAAIAAFAFCAPSIGAGFAIYGLIETRYPGGPLAAVFAAGGMYAWVVIAMALRAVRIRSIVIATRSESGADAYKASAADQLINVANRCLVLLLLANVSQVLGHAGLIVFLLLASAFTSYVELHDNWVKHLEGKVAAWGEAWRARRGDS